MDSKIIPFGKYKGQPLEALQQDQPYLDWLQNQDWFKQNYPQFNTVIINNFQEPSETPEHNKLCNLFLEREICFKLFNRLKIDRGISDTRDVKLKVGHESQKPVEQYIPNASIKIPSLRDLEDKIKPEIIEEKTFTKIANWQLEDAVFEQDSIDVSFTIYAEYFSAFPFRIEIKPSLGDDYPAILRQMNNNNSNFLIADQFTAIGASLEQVKDIFKRSNKTVYLFSEFL